MRFTRRQFVAVADLSPLTGCTSGVDHGPEGTLATTAESSADGAMSVADGAVPTAKETLKLPMNPSKLESLAVLGGPPKGGIPSIDDPSFVESADADLLDSGDSAEYIRARNFT